MTAAPKTRPSRRRSPLVALLRRGDTVHVTACLPGCEDPKAWAQLSPLGAVPVGRLRWGAVPAGPALGGSGARFCYGQPVRKRVAIFAAAQRGARVAGWADGEQRLAFVEPPAVALAATATHTAPPAGWLQRPGGTFMRRDAVRMFAPSTFAGAHDPPGAVALVLRKVALGNIALGNATQGPGAVQHPPRAPSPRRWLQRYDRSDVLRLTRGRVWLRDGWLPRSAVRVAHRVARPAGTRPTDRWIHVDLGEHTLTAWEGDQLRLATLVAIGKRRTATRAGRFAVYAKTVHSTMRGPERQLAPRGRGAEPYLAEEVPHVLHYDAGRALHGAYWHDSFGAALSHGCINLSPADAAWLFAFAGPPLPAGWHNVLPAGWPGERPLRVIVDSADRPLLGRLAVQPRKPPH